MPLMNWAPATVYFILGMKIICQKCPVSSFKPISFRSLFFALTFCVCVCVDRKELTIVFGFHCSSLWRNILHLLVFWHRCVDSAELHYDRIRPNNFAQTKCQRIEFGSGKREWIVHHRWCNDQTSIVRYNWCDYNNGGQRNNEHESK